MLYRCCMSELDRLKHRPTWLLSRAHVRAHAILTQALTAQGARGYHYRLLAALEENGPTSQVELGRLAELDPSDVNVALDELGRDRQVKRGPDPRDRRRNIVTITRSGRSMLSRLDRTVDDVQDAVLAPLSATERREIIDLLRKLAPTE